MLKTNSAIQKILLIGSILTLVSCGGGGDNTVPNRPEPIPVGTVSGVVMLGPVENATLTIYELDPKTGIEIDPPLSIEPITTSSAGEFLFTLEQAAAETPLVVCATGGTYTEPATVIGDVNGNKTFGLGDKLCATFVYKKADATAKKDTIVNITFFTHIAYGLMQYDMSNGAGSLFDKTIPANAQTGSPDTIQYGAINKANNTILQWFAFDDTVKVKLLSLEPKAINDAQSIETAVPSPGLRYGLALAGISSTVDWLVVDITKDAQAPVSEGSFKGVSSIALAQLAYNDVSFDGLLNGIAAGDAVVKMVGTTVDAQIYLHHVPARMMALLGTSVNETQRRLTDFSVFITDFSNYRKSPFDASMVVDDLNTTKPIILLPAGFDSTILVKGSNFPIKVNVLDVIGIQNTYLSVLDSNNTVVAGFNKLPPTEAPDVNDASLKVWVIDTTVPVISDGLYTLLITAINNNGTIGELALNNIKISNNGVAISIKTPSALNVPIYFNKATTAETFEAQVTDPFPNTTVIFDVVDSTVTNGQTVGLQTMPTPTIVAGTAGGVQTYQSIFKLYDPLLTVPSLSDGDYQFRVVANSTSNQTATSFLSFGFDTVLPTANITSHTEGQIVSQGALTVKADVADVKSANGYSSTLASAKLVVDNVTSTMQITNNVASGDAVIVTEGFHTLSVNVADKANNKNLQSTPIKIVYDINPPKVSIDSDSRGTNTWVQSLNFKGTALDSPGTGINSVAVSVGGVVVPAVAVNDTVTPSYTFDPTDPNGVVTAANITAKIDGKVDVVLSATDGSDKTSLASINVGFDNTSPVIELTATDAANPVLNYTPPVAQTNYTGPYNLDISVTATELGAPTIQSGLFEVNDSQTVHGGSAGSVIPDLASSTFNFKLLMPINVINTTYTVSATKGEVYNTVKKYCFETPPTTNGLGAKEFGYRVIPLANSGPTSENYLDGVLLPNTTLAGSLGAHCYSVTLSLELLSDKKTNGNVYKYTTNAYKTLIVPAPTDPTKPKYKEHAFYAWGNASTDPLDIPQIRYTNAVLDNGITNTQFSINLLYGAKDNANNIVNESVCANVTVNNSVSQTGLFSTGSVVLNAGQKYDFLMSKTKAASLKTNEAPLSYECLIPPTFTLDSNGLKDLEKDSNGTVIANGALPVKCVGFSSNVPDVINVLVGPDGSTGLQPNSGVKNSYTITTKLTKPAVAGTCP